MIPFTCTRCGLEFQAKDEFAGRTLQCSGCKQFLVVPKPQGERTANWPGGAGGRPLFSLAEAGFTGGVTLDDASLEAGQRPVDEILAAPVAENGRYIIEREISRGGMGAVLRAV